MLATWGLSPGRPGDAAAVAKYTPVSKEEAVLGGTFPIPSPWCSLRSAWKTCTEGTSCRESRHAGGQGAEHECGSSRLS